jgi:Tol biopolymer transport system component
MRRRRSWLVGCVAQVGLVAGLGCSRSLDPGLTPTEPPVDAGTPVDAVSEPMVPKTPGQDAGPVTMGIPIDAWIAFDSDGGTGNRDIYVIRADGTGRRRLTTEPSTDVQPSFSRDGMKLAFASDRDGGVLQIYVMDLATGGTTRVTQRAEGAHDPAFTIDGTRVGYRSGVYIFTALLDGTDEHPATNGQSCCVQGPFGGPVFPGDGQSMIYDDYNAIYSTTDGTTRREIVMPTTAEQSHPALSPEGSTVALQITCGENNAERTIWTVSATTSVQIPCFNGAGTRVSPIGADATHPSWASSDTLVWGSVTGGNNHSSPVPSSLVIWQNGTLLTLTSGSGDDRNPSWSPVGTVIGDW